MDNRTGYQFIRTVFSIHRNIRTVMQFRYDDVSAVTADACRTAAKAALKKSELKRQIDLKEKYNGTAADAKTERKLLEEIATSTSTNLDDAMTNLLNFYNRLNRRYKA